jgi:hypothetical protein
MAVFLWMVVHLVSRWRINAALVAEPCEAKQIEAAKVTRRELKRQVSVDIVTFRTVSRERS